MEAIIHPSTGQAGQDESESLKSRLNTVCASKFEGITSQYTFTIIHPIDDRRATSIAKFGFCWTEVSAELTSNEENGIVELTDDWFPASPI